MNNKVNKIASMIMLAGLLSACNSVDVQPVDNRTKAEKMRDKNGSFFGFGDALGSKNKKTKGEAIGVNAYLWRGALDTLSVSPLEKIDAKNGVIQTEWVMISATEKIRVGVLIISGEFLVKGVRVNVYKRIKKNGVWVDSKVSQGAKNAVADAIIQRARELRVAEEG